MTRPLRILLPGAFYHVTCRGNDRRAIFKDDRDRTVFLETLQGSLATYQVELHAYVLMHNHFHLMVCTPKANLSEFMRHFNISYTAAYNRRHRRVGHLYQGRYKAIVIDQDSYLLELSRYVHLNPVRIKGFHQRGVRETARYLERYRWSSLPGYLTAANKQLWVRYDMVLDHVGQSRKRYGQFITDGLSRGYSTPWDEVSGQVVLGKEGFIERMKGSIDQGSAKRGQPSVGMLGAKEPQAIIRMVARQFGIKEQQITGKRPANRDCRAAAMEMLYRYGNQRQVEIGQVLGGLDHSTVSRERKRLRERMREDKPLARAVARIEDALRLK